MFVITWNLRKHWSAEEQWHFSDSIGYRQAFTVLLYIILKKPQQDILYSVLYTVPCTVQCTYTLHSTQGHFIVCEAHNQVIAITDQLRNAHAQPTNCSEGIFHEREIFLIGQETLFWPGNSFIFDLDNKPCLDLEIVFFYIWTIYPVLTWQHCFSQSGQQLKVLLIIKQKF